ncbi:hypothetical protein P355_4138 [Burkholderia cenocepacia KC-01]|nr:hypothetical protein P355_4138 [Burkholderia cenocepacia KC-01]
MLAEPRTSTEHIGKIRRSSLTEQLTRNGIRHIYDLDTVWIR